MPARLTLGLAHAHRSAMSTPRRLRLEDIEADPMAPVRFTQKLLRGADGHVRWGPGRGRAFRLGGRRGRTVQPARVAWLLAGHPLPAATRLRRLCAVVD